jgi:putative mRNA 3-end processing factor
MSRDLIKIFPSGAIKLGEKVVCDGFHRDFPVRVQTHIHDDHMHDFETSKGFQIIYLTEPTWRLLISEFDADIPVRQNLIPIKVGVVKDLAGSRLMVLPADHMLGSVQVAVQLEDGMRVGYSGDFQWPLKEVIKVDQLVLDSTYGSPNCIRKYSQEEAEARLLELVMEKVRLGPVHVKAHRGTLHRAMQVLCEIEKWPIIVSRRLASEIRIYREFGYAIGDLLLMDSCEGQEAVESGRYVRLYGKGDRFPVDIPNGVTMVLSAFASDFKNPVMEYSERSLSVALTDHADFEGVLEYVRATGANYVVMDNARGGHAVELAREVRDRLGITAIPSYFEYSREWGV